MRVNNYVRSDALVRERHVLLPEDHSNRSLLSVPRGKLVAYLRHAHGAGFYLNELSSFLVLAYHDLLHYAFLIVAQR